MKKEDLLFALKNALTDEFVAKIEMQQDSILLHFLNGKSFCLNIQEM